MIKFNSTLIAFFFRKPSCGPLIPKLGLENDANFDQNIGNKFSDLGAVHFIQTLSSLNHKTNLNNRCNISCTFEFSFVLYLVPKNTPNFKYVYGTYFNVCSSKLGCAGAVVERGLIFKSGLKVQILYSNKHVNVRSTEVGWRVGFGRWEASKRMWIFRNAFLSSAVQPQLLD